MKKSVTRYAVILLVGVFLGAGLTVERAVQAERAAHERATLAHLPLRELRTFAEVYNIVKAEYVVPVSSRKLIDNALRGMVDNLDPHSQYLDPRQYRRLTVETTGRFGGVGLEVTEYKGFLKVIAPIPGTPGGRSGIHSGDLIVRINGTFIQGLSLRKAVHLLRGRPGSMVALTILRKGVSRPLTFHLHRQIIKIHSVTSRLLAPGYGYLRISEFQGATGKGVTRALTHLRAENHAPLKGLVLDLRDNPGGVLNAAVAVCNDFLNHGIIVSTRGRIPSSDVVFRAHGPDLLHGAPMVVLVNGGSASAAEIVSGALQDNRRAIIMGTRTFGKGSVQTIMPMGNGGALRLTTARYFTPNGHSIQNLGITPNIVVHEGRFVPGRRSDFLRETNLPGHLANPNPPRAQAKPAAIPPATRKLLDEDFQLRQAFDLLRGLAVYRQFKG
ncbi:S41 family peptidase [Acidiferrobacter sp.]|uniref:S41 family peptidase n=1 Tax=Acidiferrobacter sp. TaxID=1872107 RepID=UPI0026189F90|nr:S41 family peptidase [Acidiferrobacter sp.]